MCNYDQGTNEIPELLRARAEGLWLVITVLTPDEASELDRGPFVLRCLEGYNVWEGGLPAEGIADALNCYERELCLDEEEVGAAWKDFGTGWAESPRRP
jgi:hypothetical protein